MNRQLPTNLSFTIPLDVMTDKNINLVSRVIYAEILAMSIKEGYCWASNAHFVEVLGIPERTTQRAIAELVKYEYVVVENPRHSSRRIRPLRHIVTPLRQNGVVPRQYGGSLRQNGVRRNYKSTNEITNKNSVVNDRGGENSKARAFLQDKSRFAASKGMA